MRNEYPRPDFIREKWMPLNGTWNFQDGTDKTPVKIQVPFPPQSRLSGFQKELTSDRITYQRNFFIPAEWIGQRIPSSLRSCWLQMQRIYQRSLCRLSWRRSVLLHLWYHRFSFRRWRNTHRGSYRLPAWWNRSQRQTVLEIIRRVYLVHAVQRHLAVRMAGAGKWSSPGKTVRSFLRLWLCRNPPGSRPDFSGNVEWCRAFPGKITGVMLRGTTISYTIDCDGIELRADTLFETNRQRNMGEMLQLQILKEDILHLH